MNKPTKNLTVRRISGISLLVLTAMLGLAFLVQALLLYTGGGYTQESVAKKLTQMLLPSVLWALCVVATVVLFNLFPVEKQKVKGVIDPATQLKKLSAKLPKELWSKEQAALKKSSLILWILTAVVVAATLVFPLCYLLNPAHFNHTDTNTEMVDAAAHTLPFIAVAFVEVIVAYICHQGILRSAISRAKALTVQAAKAGTLNKSAEVASKDGWLDNPQTLWIVRGVIIAVSLFLIVFGIANGGLEKVMAKAVALCMECVGLA